MDLRFGSACKKCAGKTKRQRAIAILVVNAMQCSAQYSTCTSRPHSLSIVTACICDPTYVLCAS